MTSGIYERTPKHNAINSKSHMNHSVSDKTRAAISIAMKSIPHTPKHNAAVSKGHAESDVMRGGNDIVRHHFIYDHNHPENHIVKITRSQHTAHHHWMKRNGLEVPHVNIIEKNKNIFKGRKI